MRSRFFILTLIFILAFGSFAVLLAYFERSNSITLAELSTPEKSGVDSAKSFNEPVGGRAWLASVGLESFFYGVLGVCGIFLALRAIISALYIIKEERSRKMPAPVRSNIVQAPEVVIVRSRQWRQKRSNRRNLFRAARRLGRDPLRFRIGETPETIFAEQRVGTLGVVQVRPNVPAGF
jgi:hypothetical protein